MLLKAGNFHLRGSVSPAHRGHSHLIVYECKCLIIMADEWLGVDKLQHFLFCALVVFLSFLILRCWVTRRNDALLFLRDRNNRILYFSCTISLFVGVLKEVRDLFVSSGHASWKDLVADLAGVVAGALCAKSIARFWRKRDESTQFSTTTTDLKQYDCMSHIEGENI